MQYLGAEEYYFYEGLRIGHTLTMAGYEKVYDLDHYLRNMCPVTSVPMRDKCQEAFTNGFYFGTVFSDEKEYKDLFAISKPEKPTEAPVKTIVKKEKPPKDVTWN